MSYRRLARPVLLIAFVLAATGIGGPSAQAAVGPRPSQQVAALSTNHVAFSSTARSAQRLTLVRAKRPLTGERTVLPVVGMATSADGLRWLQVRLPGRPNGRTGWIKRPGSAVSTTRWRIIIDNSERRVTVYYDGRRLRTSKAVVGKPSTPTPTGEFFVEEVIKLRSSDVGAPYALALSARSNVLQEFNGGPGQIGLHGLAHVGGTLGTAVSHGCVRLENATMQWLVRRTGPGTPITITR